ncbi:carbohydrate ABC transporter permease [Allonocardiopsis opalescens]|uniref:Carbohydrate ABC transporter membrane protein 2 (CUT1 family) n=1 Tax=Allonocardiopsis opalescens TaxID=1144618 RepID=A0A2T0QEG0_9ACTN|nr:carbohydrate ABC transporter permease [Allonocardiopsis opalescens]PRY02233.1 carbohydrate ABC transporter membrane protein 2 (CUT1 family) [Allonocardiopsis opalescens]
MAIAPLRRPPAHRAPRPAKRAPRTTRTLLSPAQLRGPAGRIGYWTVFLTVFVVFTLVFLFPLYWAVTGAMKGSAELVRTPPTLFPDRWHLDTYLAAWSVMDLGRYFWNTIVVVGGAWLFQLAVAVPAAYALSKLRPVLGRAILGMMLGTLMLPAAALLVPTYLTVVEVPLLGINLINSPWAIWLPLGANAFNVYLLKRFFDQIPDALLDAARIDGAGPLTVMVRIVLPLSRPILAVVSIFAIVAAWKDFIWPLLVFPDPARQTLSVALARIEQEMPTNMLIAGLVLAALPVILVFLVFQRSILSGISEGGLRG